MLIKEKYLESLKLQGTCSPATLRVYSDQLGHIPDDFTFDVDSLYALKVQLEKYGFVPVSIQNIFRTLKNYHRWLKDNHYVTTEFPKIAIKVQKKLKGYLTEEQVEKLLKETDKTTCALPIRLMIHCGLRKSEAFSVHYGMVREKDSKYLELKILGKGGKERSVPLILSPYTEKTFKMLKGLKYLNSPGDTAADAMRTRFKEKGMVNYILKRVSKELGFKVYPHLLRHTYATLLLSKGVSMTTIQAILGHSNIQTTQMYAKITTESMRNELEKALGSKIL